MNDTSSSPSELESVTTPAKEDIPMIVIPYDEDEEVVSPHQALIVLHQPSSPEVHLSMRLGAMLRRYNWDETWMGVLPARVGHNRSLDLAISAYLEPQKLNSVVNLIAGMDSMRLYTEAVDLVQTTMNEPAFWTSEDIQLTVGVLSAYESIKGASMAYMYVGCSNVWNAMMMLSLVQVCSSTRPYDFAITEYQNHRRSTRNGL